MEVSNLKNVFKRAKDKKDSIAFRIMLTVSISIIVLMFVADIIIYYLAYNRIYDMSTNNIGIVTSEMRNNFQSMMKVQISDAENMSKDLELQKIALEESKTSRQDVLNNEGTEIELIKSKFKVSVMNKENTENVFFIGNDGIEAICTNSEYEGYDNSHYDYIKEALNGKESVSSVYTSVITSKPVITFVSPVKDEAGNVIGAVGKTVFIDYFSKRFDNFKYMGKGYVYIVDSNNNIVYHPERYYINKKNEINEVKNIVLSKKFFSKESSYFTEYDFKDKTYIANIKSIPELKLGIILTDDENEIKNVPKKLGIIISIIAFVGVLIVILMIYIVIRRLFKPMKTLVQNTNEIASGNFNIKNDVVRFDEIGRLTESFNKMASNIKQLVGNVKYVSNEIIDINSSVKDSQELVVSEMQTINNDIKNVSKGTNDISENLDKGFEAFNNIKFKVEGIKLLSDGMITSAVNIGKANNDGIKSVKELIDISNISMKSMEDVQNSFEGLIKSIDDIKCIINIVNQISNETHMLAINASIESARLGISGNSFNVIAGEIRKLSSGIDIQMENVETIVDKIKVNVSEVGEKIQSVSVLCNKEIGITKNTANNYENIYKLNNEITNSIRSLNTNLEAVNDDNQIVGDKFDKINHSYSQFMILIDEIKNVINNQYSLINKVNGSLGSMNEVMVKLNRSINKFKF